LWQALKEGFCAEVEGKADEAQKVRDFWAAIKSSAESS
jgi:hypothetical protein